MRVMKKDFSWVVSKGMISEGQDEDMWRVLARRNADRPRFDLSHVAYYLGALVVISAMTWFMTLGWESFGSGGILAISLSYALGFIIVGGLLWKNKGLKVPGGLLVTAAVCMTPLAVYSFEMMTRVPGAVVGSTRVSLSASPVPASPGSARGVVAEGGRVRHV
jgi:hypothetical protein